MVPGLVRGQPITPKVNIPAYSLFFAARKKQLKPPSKSSKCIKTNASYQQN
jgi:hypothetical protein